MTIACLYCFFGMLNVSLPMTIDIIDDTTQLKIAMVCV